MIHMGSDHRCEMATLLINMPEKKINVRKEKHKARDDLCMLNTKKMTITTTWNCPSSRKDIRILFVTIKKAAAKKEKEVHDTRNDERNTAAAAEAESTLVENVAQETEGRSKKRSSKDDNKRDTAAASEAGSTTGDTVTHETEGGSKKRSSKVEEQRGTAAASIDESALVDTVLLETEGDTTMRSSEACSPRGGYAHHEHRRPDGVDVYTSWKRRWTRQAHNHL